MFSEEGKVFIKDYVYHKIDLKCTFPIDDGEPEWIWIAKNGRPSAEIPECQDIPTCPTIQTQVDPSLPFNEEYVTYEYESYVKATGHYINDSVPIGSKVNMTCLYSQSRP